MLPLCRLKIGTVGKVTNQDGCHEDVITFTVNGSPGKRSILGRKTRDTGNPARPLADGGELPESPFPLECAVLPLWLVPWA